MYLAFIFRAHPFFPLRLCEIASVRFDLCSLQLLMLPTYYACNYFMQKFQVRAMARRDARMSLTGEILANIHMVKIWATEAWAGRRLDEVRSAELQAQQSMVWVSAIMTMLVRSASTTISVAAFMTAVLTSSTKLGSEQIFPAILLFNLLALPLSFLPMIISQWAACIVSYERIKGFCAANPETDDHNTTLGANLSRGLPSGSVTMTDTYLHWPNSEENGPFLSGVSFSVHKGQLAALCGPSSGGKSTILKLLIGSLRPDVGSNIYLAGTIAYCAQEPWLTTGTIRENILLDREWDESFYEKVVEACALDVDLAAMADGDATHIGSHGLGLSGGQKSRISLARAIYVRADIYILDDPLAAIDIGVQHVLVERLFGPRGILRSKTSIVATNNKLLLAVVDRAFEVSQGTLIETATTPVDSVIEGISPPEGSEVDDFEDIMALKADEVLHEVAPLPASDLVIADLVPEAISIMKEEEIGESEVVVDPKVANDQKWLVQPPSGLVPASVYARWLRIASYQHWAVMALLTLLSYVSNMYSRYLLRDVAQSLSQGAALKGLALYSAAGGAQIVTTCLSLIVGWYLCLKPSCQLIHRALVSGVVHAPMQFLHATATGEVFNRFANDLTRHDQPLFFSVFAMLNSVLMLVSALAVFVDAIPMAIIPILFLALFYLWLLRYTLSVLVETKRLETASRSPLITNLQETMDGADTIRIFGRYPLFRKRNYENLTTNLKAFLAVIAVDLWLVFRLSLISA